jgi:hypothetical protein
MRRVRLLGAQELVGETRELFLAFSVARELMNPAMKWLWSSRDAFVL